MSNQNRIVIKIGSNVLTRADGFTDNERICHLVDQMAALKKQGYEVILVSSGAVAAGRRLIEVEERNNAVAVRQLLAAVGQVKLINTYAGYFEKHNQLCAQVLVTKEDFRDRMHYLNMKNCLEILLQENVVPVINENDVVSVTELMFTDNDELAGLVAAMMDASKLIILSNVDGIYTGDPKLPGSCVIEKIEGNSVKLASVITTGKSEFGRGGMLTKSTMAQKTAQLGISVHIANGTKDGVLTNLIENNLLHTHFVPDKKASGKKKWIAHAENAAKGAAVVNAGAIATLARKQATSLLPIGIVKIIGNFQKGDIIRIVDEDLTPIGWGVAEYGADSAKEKVGLLRQKALIHYDYLYLTQ